LLSKPSASLFFSKNGLFYSFSIFFFLAIPSKFIDAILARMSPFFESLRYIFVFLDFLMSGANVHSFNNFSSFSFLAFSSFA